MRRARATSARRRASRLWWAECGVFRSCHHERHGLEKWWGESWSADRRDATVIFYASRMPCGPRHVRDRSRPASYGHVWVTCAGAGAVPWGKQCSLVRISPSYIYAGVAEYYFRLGSFGSPFAGIDPESSSRLWKRSCTSIDNMVKDRSITASDKNLEGSIPSWDSTPITMRGWLRAMPEYLEDLDADFPLFWSMGAVFGSNNALCGPTSRHTVALKHNLVREHSFEVPITISSRQQGMRHECSVDERLTIKRAKKAI